MIAYKQKAYSTKQNIANKFKKTVGLLNNIFVRKAFTVFNV
jgi:hypothetical protein